MVKKLTTGFLALCLMTVMHYNAPGALAASMINETTIVLTAGGSSTFDSDTNTLTWSGGASGNVLDDSFNFFSFDLASVSATFTGMNDTSAAGVASAEFDTGTWSINLSSSTSSWAVDINGNLWPGYEWSESEVFPDFLLGQSLVKVLSFNISVDGVTAWKGGTGAKAALTAETTFPVSTGLTDFGSDFASGNLNITLNSDSSSIPEPATLLLLGLGSSLFLRKRRKI